METRAHYVAVGAFVLAMVFLAFVAVLWLAGTQFSTSFAHYDIYFEGPVTGLNNGGRVEYNGIPVGTVSDIEIVTDPRSSRERPQADPGDDRDQEQRRQIKKDARRDDPDQHPLRRLLHPHRAGQKRGAAGGAERRALSGDPLEARDIGQPRGARSRSFWTSST